MLWQCGVKTAKMEQMGQDDDCLTVPVGARQSEHSAATSSAQEVEDCEDLEVVGIDSETNVVGMTWTGKDRMVNGVTDGENFTKIKGLQETTGQYERRGSFDDSESDAGDNSAGGDGEPEVTAIKPASSASDRNFSEAVGLMENPCRAESFRNIDDRSGDVVDSGHNMTQPAVGTAYEPSSHLGGLRGIPGQFGRPENHDDDDDDDDDDATDTAVKQDEDNISGDNNPVTAALVTAVDAEPERPTVPNDQSLYRACGSDKSASDEEAADDVSGEEKVDDTCVKNSAAVPFTGASDSFDEVFTKNLDSDPQTVMQNGNTEDIGTDVDNSRRSRLSRQHCEVEELEERDAADVNAASTERDGMRNWSASALQPLQEEDDGSKSDEDIDTFGYKAVNGVKSELNRLSSLGESRPAYDKADGGKTENEVRISTFV